MMAHYKAIIKERDNECLLTPEWVGYEFDYIVNKMQREYEERKYLIRFWGLNKNDIEWYKLEKLDSDVNEVTNFMYYMYNKWSLEESINVFGKTLGEHIYEKWVHHKSVTRMGELYWYSELDNNCRTKIVARANEIYNK